MVNVDVDRLRAETRSEHESVEGMVPLMDPGLTRESYAAVLACMFTVVRGWETWAVEHAPHQHTATVRQRQRSPLLQQDLAFLSVPILLEEDCGLADDLDSLLRRPAKSQADFEVRFLGAMYVMEGSTLGGQFIAKHVEETLGFAPGEGDAYFRGYGESTGSMWRSFKQVLIALPDEHSEQVISAAKAMFGIFSRAMKSCARTAAEESSLSEATILAG